MNYELDRKPVLRKKTGQGNSTIYNNITDGLWTKPVKIGPRASGWPSYETDILNRAKIAGKSKDEIKKLVIQLENIRADILSPSFEEKLFRLIEPGLLKDVVSDEVKQEV